jgi:thioester reductase-like protein
VRALLTGFPGFIGARLLRALATRHPGASFLLLVEPRLLEVASARLAELGLRDRCELVRGDLRASGLGLSEERAASLTHVWHLAAIYDLATPERSAHDVNVGGTLNVLSACNRAPHLERLMYFSTIVVNGRRTGRILEEELDASAGFFNHYESTKHGAEVEVRKRLADLPITIVRPGVVVGDSRTGETDKYDGPYYAVTQLVRSRRVMPRIGDGRAPLQIVPVDYIVDASAALAELPEALGLTFHLSAPDPISNGDFYTEAARLLGRRVPGWSIPAGLGRALMRLPGVADTLRAPRQLLDYVDHHALYDRTNTDRLLGPLGIRCPHARDYLPAMVAYVKSHPKKGFLDARRV